MPEVQCPFCKGTGETAMGGVCAQCEGTGKTQQEALDAVAHPASANDDSHKGTSFVEDSNG